MNILALDTSSSSGSIAVLKDRKMVVECTVGDAGTHSQWLLKAIDSLLKSVNYSMSDIDYLAVDAGPGSFTGLRIGISVIKGLAWALGKKVIGISTLQALSYNLPYSNMAVCPMLDARKGEIYSALYRFEKEELKTILAEQAIAPEAFFSKIAELDLGPVMFLGEGLKTYEGAVRSTTLEAKIAPPVLWNLKASNIALLAFEKINEAVTPAELVPVYLRKSEAEIKLKKK